MQSWSTVNKCEIMHVLKKNDNMEPEYILRGNQLKAVLKLRILEFTSYQIYSVSLSPPTNKCANKANSMLRFMSRMVGPRKPKLQSKLRKSLECPILKYYSPVWPPHLKKDSVILDKVQRRTFRYALRSIG